MEQQVTVPLLPLPLASTSLIFAYMSLTILEIL
jgi:hypothetical protein